MIGKPAAKILMVGFISLSVACNATTESTGPKPTGLAGRYESDTLVIESDDDKRHHFDIFLAISPQQQRRGLMFVRKMPANVGMLFVYEGSDVHSIWMKNTYIPLDLVFARSDGSVASVVHDMTPLSTASHSSQVPVTYVLELNAGTARRLNIGRKSRIIWDAD